MSKLIILLILSPSLLLFFGNGSNKTNDGKKSVPDSTPTPDSFYCPPDPIELDKVMVVLPCDAKLISSVSCDSEPIIGVRTAALDPEGIPLKYTYTVTGGLIKGKGRYVNWDLSGAKPGTYLIKVTVGFPDKRRESYTKTVTITNCKDCKSQD